MPETVVLVEDETDLLMFPPLRAAWAKEGEPTRVLLSGWNARRVVFGAMDLRTGQRVVRTRNRSRSEDLQILLAALRCRHANRPIALLLDEDPRHIAKASQALAAV